MRSRALIIGINEYPALASQRVLNGAVADAIDFAQWALDPDGGDVASDDLYFWGFPQPAAMPDGLDYLLGNDRPWLGPRPNFNTTPDARSIIVAVEAAADAAADASSNGEDDERLYVFFAGHGATTQKHGHTRDPQNCLLAADYLPGKGFGLVPLDDLRRMLELRGPAKHYLSMTAAAGELPLSVPDPGLNVPEYADMQLNMTWLVCRVARFGELAYETPPDKPERGAFTKMLVQALRQYRINDQLTLDELRGFVRQGVAELVRPKIQVPVFVPKDDAEPFVLVTGPPTGAPPEIMVHVPPGMGGQIKVLDHTDRSVVAPIPIVNNEASVTLPPGLYTIEHEPSGNDKAIFHFGPETTHVRF